LAAFALLFAAEWVPISMIFHIYRGGGVVLEIAVVAITLFFAISYVRYQDSLRRFSIELQGVR
jgi:hypothetical protein